MDCTIFGDSPLIHYLVIPLLICMSRICDVTLGTIRIITVSKGMKSLAAALGFFEVLIWLFAIGQIMQNLTHFVNYLGYATGYGIGNYIGILIEEKLSMGVLALRVVSKTGADHLIAELNEAGYGVTGLEARGARGPAEIIYTVIRRRDLKKVEGIIRAENPHAFYTVEEVKLVHTPLFPLSRPAGKGPFSRLNFFSRKPLLSHGPKVRV